MTGTNHLTKHKIEMTNKSPIHIRPYPITYAKRQEGKKEVMLKANIIEPSMSDYNSQIRLVQKKDGANIFCTDLSCDQI